MSFNVVFNVNLVRELTSSIYISLNGCVLMVLVTTFLLYEISYDRYTLRGVSKLRANSLCLFLGFMCWLSML